MKDKVCLICHTVIDTDKEFLTVKHHKNNKEIKSKAYYHVECFRNRMSGGDVQRALATKAMKLMNAVGGRVE